MAKDKDDDQGFHVGDNIRHKKNGFEGIIDRLKWSGGVRSAFVKSGKPNNSWYIYGLDEIELIKVVEKKDIAPEQTKEKV